MQLSAVYCWGDNEFGQLGIGTFGDGVHDAVRMLNSEGATAVVATDRNTCVIIDKTAYCTGDNSMGQVGDNTHIMKTTLTKVTGIGTFNPETIGYYRTVQISGYGNTICSGAEFQWNFVPQQYSPETFCWGDNSFGQQGTGDFDIRWQATRSSFCVPPALALTCQNKFAYVGDGFVCSTTWPGFNALYVRCAGRNNVGQLGNGGTGDSNLFINQPTQLGPALGMFLGGNFACYSYSVSGAIALGCWGSNGFGQSQVAPAPVGTYLTNPFKTYDNFAMPDAAYLSTAYGSQHACVLQAQSPTTFKASCVGRNAHGQLGASTGGSIYRSQPRFPFAGGVIFKTMAARNERTCYQSLTDQVFCTAGDAATPTLVQVVGFPVTSNPTRQPTRLPTRSPDTLSPTAAPVPLRDETTMAVGPNHACNIQFTPHAVFCWGDNTYGQLGIGTSGDGVHGMQQMINSSGAISVAVSEKNTCVLFPFQPGDLSNKLVFCTGANDLGQIGDNTDILRTSLTAVVTTGMVVRNTLRPIFPVQISGGDNTFCLGGKTDTSVNTITETLCWGDNTFGQLGTGDNILRRIPTLSSQCASSPPSTCLNKFVNVGGGFVCITATSATVPTFLRCAGLNTMGQLGDGTVNSRTTFGVQLNPLGTVVLADMGNTFGCYSYTSGASVRYGCWGSNSNGQLQSGSVPMGGFSTTAVQMTSSLQTPQSRFTAGYTHGCLSVATTPSTFQTSCAGSNNLGQLGGASVVTDVSVPRVSFGGGVTTTAVGASNQRTCYENVAREVYCTAGNFTNPVLVQVPGFPATFMPTRSPTFPTTFQPSRSPTRNPTLSPTTSIPTTSPSPNPTKSPSLPTQAPTNSPIAPFSPYFYPFSMSSTNPGDIACSVQFTTEVWCFGNDKYGQMGVGFPGGNYVVPVLMLNSLGTVTVIVGFTSVCVLISDGVACAGSNSLGQLGVSRTITHSYFLLATPGLFNGVVFLAGFTSANSGGADAYCVILTDDTQRCWGNGDFGKLGTGVDTPSISTPTQVLSGVSALTMGVGLASSCVVSLVGGVTCVGLNNVGQLGDNGASGTMSLTFVQVVGLLGGISQITVASFHVCVYGAVHGVMCWGAGDMGQLGNGTFANSLVPVPVLGLSNTVVLRLSAGYQTTMVLLQNLTVLCFGVIGNGLCVNSTLPTTTNTKVPYYNQLDGIYAMASITTKSCVMFTTGAVSCSINQPPFELQQVPSLPVGPTQAPSFSRAPTPPTFHPTSQQPSSTPSFTPTGMPYISLRPTTSAPTQKPNKLGKCVPQPPIEGVDFCCYSGFNKDVRFTKTPGCPLEDGYIVGPFATLSALFGVLFLIAFAQLYWMLPFTLLRGIALLMAATATVESVLVIFYNRYSASSLVLNALFLVLLFTAFSVAYMPQPSTFVAKTAMYAVVAVALVVPSTMTGVPASDAVVWLWCSVVLLVCLGEGIAVDGGDDMRARWYVFSSLLVGVVIFLPLVSESWQTQLCIGLVKVWLLFFVMIMATLIPSSLAELQALYTAAPPPKPDITSEVTSFLNSKGVDVSASDVHAFIELVA